MRWRFIILMFFFSIVCVYSEQLKCVQSGRRRFNRNMTNRQTPKIRYQQNELNVFWETLFVFWLRFDFRIKACYLHLRRLIFFSSRLEPI